MQDFFDPVFDLLDERLKKMGNPLEELSLKIDWERFRPALDQVHDIDRKSKAGAPTKDVVMMFKGLIIQNLYGLSFGQLQYQIEDRRSFRSFLGLAPHQKAPDENTFWAFRDQLSRLELAQSLFESFNEQLETAGYQAKKGQIIDASIVPVPIQRNSREENAKIKQGQNPGNWSENKARQKDADARWVKKNGKSHYGYKNHIAIDNANKLIRRYQTTDASVHDSQVFEQLLDADNTSKDVWADSAYRSEKAENLLAEKGYRSHVQRKGKRGHPLSEQEQQGNKTRAKVRARVEHVFAAQSNLRRKAIRCIGMARAATEIGLMNLVYNMRRFCYLNRVGAP